MAGKLLKEMFGLREMALEIPDEHLPQVRSAIHSAVQSKALPDSALSWFFPDKGKKDKEGEPEAEPEKPAAPAAKAPTPKAKGAKPKAPSGPDASQKAWDAMGGKKAAAPAPASKSVTAPKAAPRAEPKFDPMGSDDDYELPQFGGSQSAVSSDPAFGMDRGKPADGPYKSPFHPSLQDTGPDGVLPQQKGPGLASRAKQGLSRIFSVDPQKKLDRTMRKMDKDAQKAAKPQGALSRLIRGKDVTR